MTAEPCRTENIPGDCPCDDCRLADADRLLAVSGFARNQYQVRVARPGGGVIVCGAGGWRRDQVRDDYAALFRTDPRHVHVTRIRTRDKRTRTKR